MDLRILIIAIIGIFGSIIGVIYWTSKHTSNSKKHPCSDRIVYTDVCDEKVKRLEDCIEGVLKLVGIQYDNLNKNIEDLKELIKNGR